MQELHIFDCDGVLLDEKAKIYPGVMRSLELLKTRVGVKMVVSFNSSAEGLLRSADIRDFFDAVHKDNYRSKGELVEQSISRYSSVRSDEGGGEEERRVSPWCAFYDDLRSNIESVQIRWSSGCLCRGRPGRRIDAIPPCQNRSPRINKYINISPL